jgi:hypothetical protein
MKQTLVNVQKAFPRATIIFTNYYQIVSARSSVFGVASGGQPAGSKDASSTRALGRLARKQQKIEQLGRSPGPPTGSNNKTVIGQWPENSTAFLNTSQACFQWAIAAAGRNSQEHGDPEHPCPPLSAPLPTPSPEAVKQGDRTYLATVENRPEFAYGAKRNHLWSLPVRILFWVIHGDDMYRERERWCNTHYRGDLKQREICKFSPTAHPNREGAKAYACSIVLDASLNCHPNRPGILDNAWAGVAGDRGSGIDAPKQ